MSRFTKRLFGGTFVLGTSFYIWDRQFNESTFGRNVRTLYTAGMIAGDYKLNFNSDNAENIDQIHTRTAKRILECCQKNGGLYIKFGQQIAQQAAVLPPQYNEILKVMYDKAPIVEYDEVKKIFLKEFGKTPDDIFLTFDKEAIASASIAQVHKATLKDGTKVAVKVQKPSIRKQLDYDLFAYKALCFGFEKLFDLPIYWVTDYTTKHLRQEVDFINEANNSEKCFKFIENDPQLKDSVYVPSVYWDYTSERILTAEWIDGVPLSKHEDLEKNTFSKSKVMGHLIDLFSSQIFVTGFVHCDPHPGNIIIRSNPNTQKLQVVLLDHGLYIQSSPSFQHNYALFWKSLFTMDQSTLKDISKIWGIEDLELFASATLLRPYSQTKAIHLNEPLNRKDTYQKQLEFQARAKGFLKNTEKLPLELIFIGRNMNIVRLNNKNLGSPINRIGVMANWAVKGLGNDWTVWRSDQKHKIQMNHSNLNLFKGYLRYLQFKVTLLSFSIVFYCHKFYANLLATFSGQNVKGFEEELDDSMAQSVKENYGVDITQAFEG